MDEKCDKVAIDSDFFQKIIDKDPEGSLFLAIMNILQKKPVMHRYVFEEELMGYTLAEQFVSKGYIKIVDDQEYLMTDDDKLNYEGHFRAAYHDFNYKNFRGNIYTYRHEKESLGEIRTSLMALYLDIDSFMSDDNGAKEYVAQHLHSQRHPLIVYNIYDVLMQIGKMESRPLSWRDIKNCAKSVLKYKRGDYERLRDLWQQGRAPE